MLEVIGLITPFEEVLLQLIEEAKRIRLNAYAPYSRFQVGTAIYTNRENIYVGCNVESADYDGTHAEESAMSAMVGAGERSPLIYVTMGGLEGAEPTLTAACGKCRQKIMEFASLSGRDAIIIMSARTGGSPRLVPISKLLLDSFGPADIGIDVEKYRR